MDLNIPYIVTTCIAFLSAISSIVIAVLNNKHQVRLRELELQENTLTAFHQKKVETFEALLTSFGKLYGEYNAKNMAEFKKSYYTCILHVPKDSQFAFQNFYTLVLEQNHSDARIYLEDKVLPAVQKIIHIK